VRIELKPRDLILESTDLGFTQDRHIMRVGYSRLAVPISKNGRWLDLAVASFERALQSACADCVTVCVCALLQDEVD
jgi:hypothetical protein